MKKFYTAKEKTIAAIFLIAVAFAATVILMAMTSSISAAKDVTFLNYASQMRKMIDSANQLQSFDGVTTSWVCLGTYSGVPGDFCAGDDNPSVINDATADAALETIGTVPTGQMSPYKNGYNRGVIFKVNPCSIEMKVFVGDLSKAKIICPQLNMIQDSSDQSTCILPTPIQKQ